MNFEASLVYIENSRPAKATQKKKVKNKKLKKKSESLRPAWGYIKPYHKNIKIRNNYRN